MKVVRAIDELKALLDGRADAGFVPTMGFLHAGHMSLIERSVSQNPFTVVSVFVNPAQFAQGEDFEQYPRDLDADVETAAAAGADCLFAPSVHEMYPGGSIQTTVHPGRLGEVAEGRFRPGHFSGVATVCVKLFNIVGPKRAYFGEKDAQQLAVIRRVTADLNLPLEIIACPTVREPDGLAMSSRNARLSPEQRKAAPVLFRALSAAAVAAEPGGNPGEIVRIVERTVSQEPLMRLQYADIVDPLTFEPVKAVSGSAVITAAAFVGSVRLIDSLAPGKGR